MPALLIRKSNRFVFKPSCNTSVRLFLNVSNVFASPVFNCSVADLRPRFTNFGNHFIGFVFTTVICNNYIMPLFCQSDCFVLSQSAATAGNQCDLVCTFHAFFDYFDLQDKGGHY